MLDTLGIVHVAHASVGNVANVARRLAGKSLIHQTVRRVTDSMRLDGVIVVLGKDTADAEAASSIPLDVPVHFAEGQDDVARLVDGLTVYPAKAVVLVSANAPFVDPVLIDRLITTASDQSRCDYIGYRRQDGCAAGTSSLGLFAEWCSAKALRRADREATATGDRQDATRYIYTRPKTFRLHTIDVPRALDRDDLRLRIDREEDWDHAREIVEAIDPEDCDWQRIAGLLAGQPALRKRMARLNEAVTADG